MMSFFPDIKKMPIEMRDIILILVPIALVLYLVNLYLRRHCDLYAVNPEDRSQAGAASV